MENKYKGTKVVLMLFAFTFLMVGIFFLYEYRDITYINNQLAGNGWDTHAVYEKTRYDSKIGEFYKLVIYEEYEDYTYEYRVRESMGTRQPYVHTFLLEGSNGFDDVSMPYQFAVK
ncbi:hypothetical protein [Alkalibacterium sp. MB6]|uniref:hypothetical protein n=1 Tax=Alkalibacterium sp. MB6 TaxID=2081965 RepID=UPI00137B5FE2|nr:hypothetical protein [Alkalibacterium sp. MB6]